MPQAALPISMIAAGGLSAAGSVASAKAAQPQLTKVPPPAPIFPGVNESYLKDLTSSGVTPTSFGTITEAAKTGLPTDVGPAFEAMKAASKRGIDEGRTNLIEKYGAAGVGSGSDILKAGADYEIQAQKDFASILADYTRTASEAAAQRRLAASEIGISTSAEPALALAPTAVVSGGAPSAAGAGLTSAGSSLTNLVMMKALFPDMFRGGSSGGGGGGTYTGLG